MAHDLASAGQVQAGAGQGGFQVAGGRQGVRGVVGGVSGRDEGAHGLVRDRALGPLGRGEQAGHHAPARPGDAGRLAQRFFRIAGELERVDPGHRVERGVAERQRLHVALAQVGAWEPVPGDLEQARADVHSGRDRTALLGQDQGEPGAAAHVEQPGAPAYLCRVEHRLEQRPVVRFGQVRPGLRVGAPQAALDPGPGAGRLGVHPRRAVRRSCRPAMTSLSWCSSTGWPNSGPPSCQATSIGPDLAVLISRAAQPGQPGALPFQIGDHPGDVADRARGDLIGGREAVVDRVDLVELDHDRAPRGEGGGVVEHDVAVGLVVDSQHELLEGHALDDLERPDAQVPVPPLHRGVQVVDPVPDVVQGPHQPAGASCWSRAWSAPPPNCRSWSMVIRMNG